MCEVQIVTFLSCCGIWVQILHRCDQPNAKNHREYFPEGHEAKEHTEFHECPECGKYDASSMKLRKPGVRQLVEWEKLGKREKAQREKRLPIFPSSRGLPPEFDPMDSAPE